MQDHKMNSLGIGLSLALLGAALSSGCYEALEDEAEHDELAINSNSRTPNMPPVGAGTTPATPSTPGPGPTTTAPNPTPTDPSSPVSPGAGGAPTEPDPAGPDPLEDVCDPTPIFQDTSACGGLACHGTADQEAVAYVDLVRTELVGAEGTGTCAGQYIIDPANPDASLLITKLSDSPPCGAQMPYAGFTITTEQRDCLIEWARAKAAAANQ